MTSSYDEQFVSATLIRPTLQNGILVACAVLVASGNFTAKAAVNMALELNDILTDRLGGSY